MRTLKSTIILVTAASLLTGVGAAPAAGPEKVSSPVYYQVRVGDTLWSIARKFGVNVPELIQANNLQEPSALRAGQRLIIPSAAHAYFNRIAAVRSGVKVKSWRYIIIHHSATSIGNVRRFDYFHRKMRHMPRGMAYHFVIGNGKGLADGAIEAGSRWKLQYPGGHVKSDSLNEIAIGICLVGNFEKTPPTAKQMESLSGLVRYLQANFGIPRSRVMGHRNVREAGTRCPGRLFPMISFKKGILP